MDPITLDPPVKFPPVPPPVAAPRAVTPAPPKDGPASALADPSASPPAGPPAPRPGGGKQLLVVGAAVASLAVGAAGVRYFFGGTPAGEQPQTADAKVTVPPAKPDAKAEPPPAPAPPPQFPPRPKLFGYAYPYPPSWQTGWRMSFPEYVRQAPPPGSEQPLMPPAVVPTSPDGAPAAAAAPAPLPVTPASLPVNTLPEYPSQTQTTMPGPSMGLSVGPGPGVGPASPIAPPAPVGVVPAGGIDVPKPAALPPSGLPATPPPLPVLPMGLPAAPASPSPNPTDQPAAGQGGPVIPPASLPPTPAPAVVPVSPAPLPTGSTPGGPAVPAPQSISPTPAKRPDTPPPAALPTTPPPTAAPLEFTKPAAATAPGGPTVAPGAAPPAAERPPQTSFDVDVYYPKPGDRYEAVSREFYADGRFAAALQAYNRNRQLVPDQPVDVPPVHVLKKQFPQLTGGTVPVGTRAGLPAAGEWQSGAAADPFRASRPRSYTVPAGGTTMRVVARDALGDASRWQEVYDLNPSYAPNQVPEGATLRLPAARGSE